jgi:lipopolysaccharide biosynthesis glycosyltransferase
MKEKIHIVFSPDENYAVLAGVAVTSILHHASEPGRFHFYFLQGNRKLSDRSRAKFSEVIETYGAALDYVEVDVRLLAEFENLGPERLSPAVYYLMMIPNLLPNLERCLYLDCDVLALGNLAELWDTVNPDAGVAAVADCNIDRDRVSLEKYEVIKRYFNAGVMLMNLQRWRERERVKSCLQLSANPRMHDRFANQDVLNVIFRDDVYFLHPRWNIQGGQKPIVKTKELDQEWREILQAPRIAHFAGSGKPCNMGMAHRWSMEYWRMLAKTPWGREMPDLGGKMRVASLHRLKRVTQRTLRWMLDARMNLEAGTCRIVLFGHVLVDLKPRKQTGQFQP